MLTIGSIKKVTTTNPSNTKDVSKL